MSNKDGSDRSKPRDVLMLFLGAVFTSVVPLLVNGLLSLLNRMGQVHFPTVVIVIATVLISAVILVAVFLLGAYLGILWFIFSMIHAIGDMVKKSTKMAPDNLKDVKSKLQEKDV